MHNPKKIKMKSNEFLFGKIIEFSTILITKRPKNATYTPSYQLYPQFCRIKDATFYENHSNGIFVKCHE